MFRLAYPLIMMLMPRVLPVVIRYVRLVWRLTFDKRVSIFLRALLPVALLYILSPIDLISDRIPVLGRLDDSIILGLALLFLIKLSPPHVVDEHLGRAPKSDRPEDKDPSSVVDGSVRFIDDEK